jgi:hypothetical protein
MGEFSSKATCMKALEIVHSAYKANTWNQDERVLTCIPK